MNHHQSWPIIITTIFPPNEVTRAYADLGHPVIIVGDKKTPVPWVGDNCRYLSVEEQRALYPDFADSIPWNHYGRKNIGYLAAMKDARALIETDDDNLPLENYPTFTTDPVATTTASSNSGLCNVYQHFLPTGEKRSLWPRGFPLDHVLQKPVLKKEKTKRIHFIQQGLINGDTDVDAIYRLTNNTEISFKPSGSLVLAPHTYGPINTQNTFWMREAFVLLYLPVFATFRSCDIYKGWIAQRLLWEIDSTILFTAPSVVQKRNPHDYIRDFESEIPLFLHTNKFLQVLEGLKLTGSLSDKFLQTYIQLAKHDLIDPRELPLALQWVKAVEKLL